MKPEQAEPLRYGLVDFSISTMIMEMRKLPTRRLYARLIHITNKACLFAAVVDGETGEILTFPGEDLWIPLSQIDWMHKAGQPEEPPEEDDTGLTDPVPGQILPPNEPEIDLEPEGDSPERQAFDRQVWEREKFGPPASAPLQPICHTPALVSREALSGAHSECGPAEMVFHADCVELAVSDEEGFPRRLRISDDALYPVALLSFLADGMLTDTTEARMSLTIRQLETTKEAARAFLEAADAAIREIEEQTFNRDKQERPKDYKTHTAFASKAGGAVRRASMDLTRSLTDLRRPS